MTNINTEEVKGFQNYTGEIALKREKIVQIIIENFKLYGFEPAETPIIEYEEFVKGDNKQDEAVSDIFKLEDKGKRKLALRYELTFPLKRISKNKKLPYKRYQIGEVFRDEPVSSSRFRQFTQADIDIIGSSIKQEAEILALTSRVLNELGIAPEINVNNRKLLNEILEENQIKDKISVIKEIDKLDKLPEKELKANLKKLKAEKILNIIKDKQKCKKFSAYKEIEQLEKFCKLYNIKINFTPSLARGLSYYNGNVFEVKVKTSKESICGGGSYMFNNIQSTGISFGIERLTSLANLEIEDTDILIISLEQDKTAIKLAENLRNNELSCQIFYGKISKALDYANSKKINYVVIIGEQEVKKKKFKLKDMKSGKESFLGEKELIENTKPEGL